jgi:hypothetical protein
MTLLQLLAELERVPVHLASESRFREMFFQAMGLLDTYENGIRLARISHKFYLNYTLVNHMRAMGWVTTPEHDVQSHSLRTTASH